MAVAVVVDILVTGTSVNRTASSHSVYNCDKRKIKRIGRSQC